MRWTPKAIFWGPDHPGHGIMLRALEGGTAGLHVPTGEVRLFPKNTSDALTSGGTYAIAVRWSACTSIWPSTAGGACASWPGAPAGRWLPA
jgi:hypothetical protein